MKDKEFLIWIHERLEYVYGESPVVDYMHKLRAIIKATPADRITPNINTGNSLKDIKNDRQTRKTLLMLQKTTGRRMGSPVSDNIDKILPEMLENYAGNPALRGWVENAGKEGEVIYATEKEMIKYCRRYPCSTCMIAWKCRMFETLFGYRPKNVSARCTDREQRKTPERRAR